MDTTWTEMAARGAAWMKELGRRLEEDAAHRRQLEAAQQQRQRFMEEISARAEERLQQAEERVAQVEESLLKALGSVKPKVDLMTKYQSFAAISNVSKPVREDASAGAPSTPADSSPGGRELERRQPSAPSDGGSPRSTASPTALLQQRTSSQTETVTISQERHNVPTASVHVAAAQGDVAALERMLADEGWVDARDSSGDTALHLAASHGRVEAVHLLILRGSLVDSRGERARTPLHRAASGGHVATVARLLAAGASVNAKDEEGESALALAAASGHENVVDILLDKEAAVNLSLENA